MKRTKRTFKVDHYIDWAHGVSMEELESTIAQLKAKGVDYVDCDIYEEYGETIVEFTPYCTRMETEEEAKERLKTQRNRLEQQRVKLLSKLNSVVHAIKTTNQ